MNNESKPIADTGELFKYPDTPTMVVPDPGDESKNYFKAGAGEGARRVTILMPTLYQDPNNPDVWSDKPFAVASSPVEAVSPAGRNDIPVQDEVQNLRYAKQLAMHMAEKFYPEVPQWKPLDGDMFGLLMQIDNMSTGLARITPPSSSEGGAALQFDHKAIPDTSDLGKCGVSGHPVFEMFNIWNHRVKVTHPALEPSGLSGVELPEVVITKEDAEAAKDRQLFLRTHGRLKPSVNDYLEYIAMLERQLLASLGREKELAKQIAELSEKLERAEKDKMENIVRPENIDEAAFELFISERYKVANEWNVETSGYINPSTIAGIDAEVNRRLRVRLMSAESRIAAIEAEKKEREG